MYLILDFLEENGYELNKASVVSNKITNTSSHIYTKKDNLFYCIIAPHDGNDYKYILRINPVDTFDRWNVCDYEKSFETSLDLIKALRNELEIYKELLDIYVGYYKENEDIDE